MRLSKYRGGWHSLSRNSKAVRVGEESLSMSHRSSSDCVGGDRLAPAVVGCGEAAGRRRQCGGSDGGACQRREVKSE